jgi:mannose-1-phosphate guanylyltransferase
MRKAHELIDFSDYQDLFNRYEDLNKISFDYAVVEKEESIAVMRFAGEWKDLGTWNTLTESMTENTVGSVILADDCENVHVINELDIPVIGMGLKDVVVAASPDGILVSDKEQSGYLKKYVERLDEQVRYAEKSWGEYRVLDIGDSYETVKITVLAGHRMSYHSHQHRDEMWTVISGKGRTIVDGMEQNVEAGDVITMQAGCRHTVIAETDLNIIEVQIGREISAHDKQKYELER